MSGSTSSLGAQVDATYRDVVGHGVSDSDRGYWEGMIGSGQRSLADVRSYLASTQEAGDAIQGLYGAELWRGASGNELADRRTDLANGQSLAGLRWTLAHTGEAANDINYLYQQVLGRNADAYGLNMFQGFLGQSGTLGDIRSGLAHAPEATADVEGIFQAVLGHGGTAGDDAYWTNRLATDLSLAQVRTVWAYSGEAAGAVQSIYQQMFGRAATAAEVSARQADLAAGASLSDLHVSLSQTNDAMWSINYEYMTVLGRSVYGDAVGLAGFRAELAAGTSLSTIRQQLAHTAEAASNVNGLYQQVLGRNADAYGLGIFQDFLGQNGTLGDVRNVLAHAPETPALIQNIFQSVLGHAATAGDVAYWEDRLAQGMSLAQVRTAWAYSGEAAGDIQAIYQADWGRGAADWEVGVWQSQLSQGATLAGIRTTFAYSPEAAGAINRLYQQVLGRDADAYGLGIFQGSLNQGLSLGDVRYGLAHAPEVPALIQGIFQGALGHAATEGDVAYWEDRLAQGMSLAEVRTAWAYSGEAAGDIQSLYQGMWGRGAADWEVGYWQSQLSQGTSLAALRTAFAYSTQAASAIQGLYQMVLQHGADAGSVGTFQGLLLQGWSLGDVRSSLAHSAEASADVASAFRNELGREAQAPDFAFWQGHLATDATLASIRTAFAYSDDATNQIQGIYQADTWGNATAGELAQRQAELSAGATLSDLRRGVAHSAAAAYDINYLYQQVLGRDAGIGELADRENDLANGQTLNGLRTSLSKTGEAAEDIRYLVSIETGRTADAGDIGYWEGRLATDLSLAGVQNAFAYSEEAAAQIRNIYQSVLGRAASDAELSSRQADLKSGASLDDLRWSLSRTGEAVADIQTLYVQVLGRLGNDGEVFDRQVDLAGGQSLAGLRGSLAGTGEAASDIQGIFQKVLGRAASANEVASYQQVLGSNGGWTMALVGPAVANVAINNFYQQVFGRDAVASEVSGMKAALAAGQTLTAQFNYLRPIFANSDAEASVITQFYLQTFGRGCTQQEVTTIEAAVSAGQSLLTIEDNLTPAMARQIKAAYRQDLGHDADWAGLSFWEGQAANRPMTDVIYDIAHSQESVIHIQTLFQQNFHRYASLLEVQGFQNGESAPAPAGALYTVAMPPRPAVGDVLPIPNILSTADARTIVVEAAAYIGLAGGVAPTLTAPDGTVITFRNGYEFAAYALGLANKAGQLTSSAMQTYKLTVGWLDQVGQADIQAAVALQARALADSAAGRYQNAYLEGIGAQLAAKIQQQAPDKRGPMSQSVAIGQFVYTVTVTGDANDPSGLAGYGYTVTDSDPDRTRLIAKAQAEIERGVADGAAGNQLLAFLDNAQARVDVAYAALPRDARADRMLGVAQQFVDAAYAAAGQGNWNLVQTLETAADVSLQIAAMPEGSRHALTERFMHENVKHDITVDPNTADPFASFKDHSKGQDVIGAIVEGVAGAVINILAVIPFTAPVFVPIAVAWDVAQAGKNFSQGNILGGFLSLASAAAVGLNGLGTISQAGQVQGASSFAQQAGGIAENAAKSLGFTATSSTALNAAGQIVTVTTTAAGNAGILGAQIAAGTALVGGSLGIAQSAQNGDALGIAAGVLEVAAAVAGGLVATNSLPKELAGIASTIRQGAGLASAAASAADAFANGNLAGGLATSLGALFTLISLKNGERTDTPTATSNIGEDLLPPVASSIGAGSDGEYLTASLNPYAAFGPAAGASSTVVLEAAELSVAQRIYLFSQGYLIPEGVALVSLPAAVAAYLFWGGPAMPAPQTTSTGVPNVTVTHAPDQTSYVLNRTDPATGAVTYIILKAGPDGMLRSPSGQVIGDITSGTPYFSYKALTDFVFPSITIDPNASKPQILSDPITDVQHDTEGFSIDPTTGKAVKLTDPINPALPNNEGFSASDLDPATIFERSKLRGNMQQAGTLQSGDDAHHIVPGGGLQSGGRDASAAQSKLAALGVDINGADNGVSLSPGFHSRIHTADYYNYVNTLIGGAATAADAVSRLQLLRGQLQQADEVFQSTGKIRTWP